MGTPPDISDLYLAFRQAKCALYFEKRGVGLLDIARYEENLTSNLIALKEKLDRGSWFDHLDIGRSWIVPKRFRPKEDQNTQLIKIGAENYTNAKRPIDVQVRISPHPDFAITEVLYLWQFGGRLESILSPSVLGYRLDLKKDEVEPNRRWLFEYWPKRYQQFRSEPLVTAQRNVDQGGRTLIVSGDLASFYDTIEPSFMLGKQVLSKLAGPDASGDFIASYRHATSSLLRAYRRFHALASKRTGARIQMGVPIGALTSRLIANVALTTMDDHIESQPGVLCYRRYVDDLVIVAKSEGESVLAEVIHRFLPIKAGDENTFHLDADTLKRKGSEFELQRTKVKVHDLAGEPGADFINAIQFDFSSALSDRRAFIDTSALLGEGVSHLVRAGRAEGSPLRVLRDADRARLERFALSTSLRSLERVSSLIDRKEALRIVRKNLSKVGRVLDSEDNWVTDLDVSLRLLKLAISAGDWKSARELQDRMDAVWGTTDHIQAAAGQLYYRGKVLPNRQSQWVWLRNYLHELRLEAVVSCLPIGSDAALIAAKFPGGLRFRSRNVKATTLRHKAQLLAASDLRARDREEDAVHGGLQIDGNWVSPDFSADEAMLRRLKRIERFTKKCKQLGDHSWVMPAARLYLCTRPPSYFDIARRWLYRTERDGFDEATFSRLIRVVNAVRGTSYSDPIGHVTDADTVLINPPAPWRRAKPTTADDPRIILGNLVVEDAAWIGAATRTKGPRFGKPLLTWQRLQGLTEVLEKAARVTKHDGADLLVLPELSLPRKWFRTVANHVVKTSKMGLVAGLEYNHHPKKPHVDNQVFAVLPGPFMSVATWPWTKRFPAREEAKALSKLNPPVSLGASLLKQRRTVVETHWGAFSVLICSELIEARQVADLLGRVQLVLCPAWNPDTASYDHLIQSAGFQLHSVIAISNNGHYSDCRAWAPRTERWQRDLCRLIERDVNDVVHVDVPLSSLRAFHSGDPQTADRFKRLREALSKGDMKAAKGLVRKLDEESSGPWRPLPPDWD
jgi:predicted amidohydrolase